MRKNGIYDKFILYSTSIQIIGRLHGRSLVQIIMVILPEHMHAWSTIAITWATDIDRSICFKPLT